MPKNGWGAGCQFTRGHSPCASAVEGRNTEDDRPGDVPGCAGRPLDVPPGISREVRGGVRPCGHLQNSLRRGDAKRANQDDTAANSKRTTSRNPYDCNELSLRVDGGGGAVRGGRGGGRRGGRGWERRGGRRKTPCVLEPSSRGHDEIGREPFKNHPGDQRRRGNDKRGRHKSQETGKLQIAQGSSLLM